jgi:murein DD-endopeptidase MepM/ murein hydrolase activator NlpD
MTLVTPVGSAAAGEGDLHDRRDSAAQRVERAELQLGESSDRLRTANMRLEDAMSRLRVAKADLLELDTRVLAARARDEALRADLSGAELRLGEARAALSVAVAGVADQKQPLIDSVVGVYQGDDAGLLAVSSVLDSESTEDLARRQSAVEALLSKQTRAYDTFRSTQVLAEVGEERVEEVVREVAARQRAAAAGLRDLQDARREARSAAREVVLAVRERRRSRQRAAQIRSQDLAVLRRAEAKEARIRQRIKQAARRQAAQARQNPRSSSGTEAWGFLMPPVVGAVSSPFGYRVHPIFKYWGLHDGIDYAAGCGGALWAGAEGVVTAKYYSDVYGYRLFVNVGSAGGTGWSTGCHLHFTVLANGRPLDPEDWY